MLAKVPPLAKPVRNEAFALAAAEVTPPGPGASGRAVSVNALLKGGLVKKLSATVAGNASAKKPKPPRITVGLFEVAPKGVQAKPIRGCHAMLVRGGRAWWRFVRMASL